MKQKLKTNNQIIKPRNTVVKDIVNIINSAKNSALKAVNTSLVIMYWQIGKRINKEIKTTRSDNYGKQLINNLSINLSMMGKGFDKSTLYKALNFYILYPNILETVSPQSFLPWSDYVLLISIKDKKERDWYESETLKCCWSYRQLKRNIKTDYYHRVLSNQIVHKSNNLTTINQNDYLKSIYIFDFLNFKYKSFNESDLEQALIDNLKSFMLELGKGYSFIGNQVHLRSNNQDYYIDLVFYNTILKCNVLIDLKIDKIIHKDIGQMLLYLDLYDKQYKHNDDNKSIGIILSTDINSDIVKYLTNETDNHIVNSKYLTYLPTKEQLIKEINKQKLLFERSK